MHIWNWNVHLVYIRTTFFVHMSLVVLLKPVLNLQLRVFNWPKFLAVGRRGTNGILTAKVPLRTSICAV